MSGDLQEYDLSTFDLGEFDGDTPWQELGNDLSEQDTTANAPEDLILSSGLRIEWHKTDAVLNRVLEILQYRKCPDSVRIFPTNPDYNTLLQYYGSNRNAADALYIVHKNGTNFSSMAVTNERRMNDWGNAIENHPRFHLLGDKWIFNAKVAPTGTTASLLCRGGDYRKALRKHQFERLLKPWRCAPYGVSYVDSGNRAIGVRNKNI